MKAVMLSIQPHWCQLIANGNKTIEVRKTKPKLEAPFKVYIYCTKDNTDYVPSRIWWKPDQTGFLHIMNGRVIGEFICDKIQPFDVPYPAFQGEMDKSIMEQSCLNYWQLHRYAYHDCLYGWHISELVIYDEPKPLNKFVMANTQHYCHLQRPPQSWCYVEEV